MNGNRNENRRSHLSLFDSKIHVLKSAEVIGHNV